MPTMAKGTYHRRSPLLNLPSSIGFNNAGKSGSVPAVTIMPKTATAKTRQ